MITDTCNFPALVADTDDEWIKKCSPKMHKSRFNKKGGKSLEIMSPPTPQCTPNRPKWTENKKLSSDTKSSRFLRSPSTPSKRPDVNATVLTNYFGSEVLAVTPLSTTKSTHSTTALEETQPCPDQIFVTFEKPDTHRDTSFCFKPGATTNIKLELPAEAINYVGNKTQPLYLYLCKETTWIAAGLVEEIEQNGSVQFQVVLRVPETKSNHRLELRLYRGLSWLGSSQIGCGCLATVGGEPAKLENLSEGSAVRPSACSLEKELPQKPDSTWVDGFELVTSQSEVNVAN
mmetsp:Transcript_4095/g.7911  ORF Transcript_4095/g.7911 Transcript_4095/m.7911 type:complete len:289 (-) Transcript_4095:358-1224(-)